MTKEEIFQRVLRESNDDTERKIIKAFKSAIRRKKGIYLDDDTIHADIEPRHRGLWVYTPDSSVVYNDMNRFERIFKDTLKEEGISANIEPYYGPGKRNCPGFIVHLANEFSLEDSDYGWQYTDEEYKDALKNLFQKETGLKDPNLHFKRYVNGTIMEIYFGEDDEKKQKIKDWAESNGHFDFHDLNNWSIEYEIDIDSTPWLNKLVKGDEMKENIEYSKKKPGINKGKSNSFSKIFGAKGGKITRKSVDEKADIALEEDLVKEFTRMKLDEEREAGLETGRKYEINVKALYDEFGKDLEHTHIEKEKHGEDEYYDLYKGNDLAIMESEPATLKEIKDDKEFIFKPEMGTETFSLSKKEAEVGVVATTDIPPEERKKEYEKDYQYFQDILDKAREKEHRPPILSPEEVKAGLRVVKGEKPIKDNPLPDEIDRGWDDEEVVNEVLGTKTAWQRADNAIRRFVQDVRDVYKKAPFGAHFDGLEYSSHNGYQVTIYTEGPKCMELAEAMKKNIQEMLDEKGYSDINIVLDKDEFEEEGGCYLTIFLNEF